MCREPAKARQGWTRNGGLTFIDSSGRLHGAHGHTFWLVGPTGVHGYKHQHLSVYRQGVWVTVLNLATTTA